MLLPLRKTAVQEGSKYEHKQAQPRGSREEDCHQAQECREEQPDQVPVPACACKVKWREISVVSFLFIKIPLLCQTYFLRGMVSCISRLQSSCRHPHSESVGRRQVDEYRRCHTRQAYQEWQPSPPHRRTGPEAPWGEARWPVL